MESKDETVIRTQLESYQQRKNINQSSQKGKSDKTKCSENYQLTDNDGASSLGEVTIGSEDDEHKSLSAYMHDPSIMKKHRPRRPADYLHLEHPTMNQRMAPNKFKQTDLNKIKNIKNIGGGIKNAKFFNMGTKNFI